MGAGMGAGMKACFDDDVDDMGAGMEACFEVVMGACFEVDGTRVLS